MPIQGGGGGRRRHCGVPASAYTVHAEGIGWDGGRAWPDQSHRTATFLPRSARWRGGPPCPL